MLLKEAKRLNCDTQIINSNYTIKTTWEMIKLEMGRKVRNDNIHSFNVKGRVINNQQTTADTVKNYFLS
jgi:hypothetical protein